MVFSGDTEHSTTGSWPTVHIPQYEGSKLVIVTISDPNFLEIANLKSISVSIYRQSIN